MQQPSQTADTTGMNNFKSKFRATLAAIVAAVALISAAPAVAHADIALPAGVVQVNSATFVQTKTPCSCVATIDGYLFQGMPYYDGTTASAAGLWLALRAQPGYVSNPPIASISTTTIVTGTVAPPGSTSRSFSTYGTGDYRDTYGTGTYGTGTRKRTHRARHLRRARRAAHRLRNL